MSAISTLCGFFIFGLGTLGAFVMMGGHLPALVQIGTLLAVLLAPLGSALMAFGFPDVLKTFLAFRFLFYSPKCVSPPTRAIPILRYLIVSTYAVGGLACLFGGVVAIASAGGVPGAAERVGEHLAAASIALAYPVLLSEALLRPLKARLESPNPALPTVLNSL